MATTKIFFKYDETPDGRYEVESMWAEPQADGYKLDNIPFHAKGVACGDVVAVTAGPDGAPWYDRLVLASGHSTIRLWFTREEDVKRVRDELRDRGCESEQSELARLVAVDVPPRVPYAPIKARLDAQEREGLFEYEEACLGQR